MLVTLPDSMSRAPASTSSCFLRAFPNTYGSTGNGAARFICSATGAPTPVASSTHLRMFGYDLGSSPMI